MHAGDLNELHSRRVLPAGLGFECDWHIHFVVRHARYMKKINFGIGQLGDLSGKPHGNYWFDADGLRTSVGRNLA